MITLLIVMIPNWQAINWEGKGREGKGRETATIFSDKTESDLDGDLFQNHSMAFVAIDYLPNFAVTLVMSLPPLSMKLKSLTSKQPLNTISLSPPLSMKHTITKTPNSKSNGTKPSRKSSGIWPIEEYGTKSSTQSFPKDGNASSPSRYSRSSTMACPEPAWLPVAIARFSVSTSLRTTLQ